MCALALLLLGLGAAPDGARAVSLEAPAAVAPELTAALHALGFAVSADAPRRLVARSAVVEGATVIGVALYEAGAQTPSARARIAAIGAAAIRAEAEEKLAALLGASAPAPPPAETAPPAPVAPARAAPTSPPAAPPRSSDPLVQLIREVAAELEQVRGLRRTADFKVELLDDALFSKALRAKALKELTPALVAAERARWLAFGLAPATVDPRGSILAVLDEQAAGFYDPFTRTLYVRRSAPDEVLRDVLAHELEHALQDQVFGIPDLAALPDDDTRLAVSALYEGDAMAAMAAVAAHHAHRPVRLAVQTAATALHNSSPKALLKLGGHSPALEAAPAILREELLMPYVAGLSLVAEVLARGGFPLVDRMFRHPPSSSHQVLHPEAYLRGDADVRVGLPAAPPGTRVVAAGRLGELGTRVALEACVDPQVVKDFTGRWQGDAYTIFEDAQKRLGLVWSTAWQPGGGAPIANLLSMEQPCWDEAATGARNAAGSTMGAFGKVRAAGDRVALARGLEPADASARAALAARAAPAQEPKPPLGELPPPVAIEPARVEGGHFTSARLGLRGAIPAGYDADVSGHDAEISIARKAAGGAFASLSLVPEALTPERAEAFFDSTAAAAAAARLGGAGLAFSGKGQRLIADLPAEERSWDKDGGGGRLRIALAPLCGGRAFAVLLRVDSGDGARAAADRFAASLERSGEPQACRELE